MLKLGFEGLGNSLHGKLEAFQAEGMTWVKAWRLKQCECGDLAGAEDELSAAGCRQLQGAAEARSDKALGTEGESGLVPESLLNVDSAGLDSVAPKCMSTCSLRIRL